MFVDMPLSQLRAYLPERAEPADFDAFWERTLAEARAHDLAPVFTPVASELTVADVHDVTFAGFGGDPIKGWLLLPRHAAGPVPCVVEYQGYGGGRGLPIDWLLWPGVGYAVLAMDSRGQGAGGWRRGDTPDPYPGTGPQTPGVMTSGVHDPAAYYYRRLYTDAVRAVEAARAHPGVSAVAVGGASQGGAIALAVAALARDLACAFVDVPFLCHVRHATEITGEHPYAELAAYCRAFHERVEDVFATLAYFDGVNFAARAATPALFSVGLRDGVTPPSTVFAAYNHYAGEKDIKVYPYSGHEGGESAQAMARIARARKAFG
ncbi:Cephalosporin-C deacetylase [Nonomuraea coxensis DSM 45129]|uniref:Cephalosporin-C deacetylase n=1 Tax=Nonomuraea coxensis DSM 45129 TaxID=1122611 RepID=A0ABX8U861_9ACTN|nr:acetylxylan esterase [Nonomuraea coxensis]QYC42944.1 Cephalosporin-C deacetylase [Nonomuraea coxensis DSM 45129]